MRLITAKLDIQALTKGMTIVEYGIGNKPKRIEVTEVEHGACSSRGTHVNKSMCYNAHAVVDIMVATEKQAGEMDVREMLEYVGVDPVLV